jgi:hypothetical protein
MHIEKATACLTAWKSAEQLTYAVQAVKTAREKLLQGQDFFGPDDMPENQAGQNIPGIAFRILCLAGIIRPYYGTQETDGILYGRRKSKHESRNGAKIQLYSLVNMGMAESFLERNGAVLERGQLELAM